MARYFTPTSHWSLRQEEVLSNGDEPPSVLDVALSLNLDGPPDWATNINSYLYGNLTRETNEHESNGK